MVCQDRHQDHGHGDGDDGNGVGVAAGDHVGDGSSDDLINKISDNCTSVVADAGDGADDVK